MKIEEQYEDVLQNIESSVVGVYRTHPELTDWDVELAYEALIQFYNAEAHGRPVEVRQLPGIQAEVMRGAQAMCEWRLGRATVTIFDEHDQPVEIPLIPLTTDEVVACLKRLRKSVRFWTKEGGRQGYLNYIVEFLP
jgi:hypothetical protein